MKSRVYACRLLPPSSIGHYEENNANINLQGWDVDSRRNMQQTQQHSTHAIICTSKAYLGLKFLETLVVTQCTTTNIHALKKWFPKLLIGVCLQGDVRQKRSPWLCLCWYPTSVHQKQKFDQKIWRLRRWEVDTEWLACCSSDLRWHGQLTWEIYIHI